MTIDTITETVRPVYRDAILSYASHLLAPADRGPDAVIAKAQPLLEWAAAATDSGGLRARMWAMDRADRNDQARLRADRSPEPARLSPDEFLANTRAYYEFITGVTDWAGEGRS